jgi:CO dehydrogenase maturation factor
VTYEVVDLKIAVSGKGGVGKTTVSAGLARLFAGKGYHVIAVDADPDASLGMALGIDDKLLAAQRPVVEMKELIKERTGGGGSLFCLNPKVDDVLDRFALKMGEIRFLRMGGIKQGGSDCYCSENSFINALVNSLLLDRDDVVILDMSAGIEHFTRGTAKGVDVIVVVTEPTRISAKTARVVLQLAGELGIKRSIVVGNKIRSQRDLDFLQDRFPDLVALPLDEALLEGDGTVSSAFAAELEELFTAVVEAGKGGMANGHQQEGSD